MIETLHSDPQFFDGERYVLMKDKAVSNRLTKLEVEFASLLFLDSRPEKVSM